MRVMVLGAATPLGSGVVERLGHDHGVARVLAVDAGPPSGPRSRHVVVHRAALRRGRDVHDVVWGPARGHAIDTVVALPSARGDDGPRWAEQVGALLDACAGHPTIRRVVIRSFADVYATRQGTTAIVTEAAPLELSPELPAWRRDRIGADITACAHLGAHPAVVVLRCAELFAAGCDSQLWDYVGSRLCLRPWGFDPMLNLLSLPDAVAAHVAAVHGVAVGAFNVPDLDTLPLSRLIHESRRRELAVPGPLLGPLYDLRRATTGAAFHYRGNARRLHVGGVLDGTRARDRLGYLPRHHVTWPSPWWRRLVDGLRQNRVADDADLVAD